MPFGLRNAVKGLLVIGFLGVGLAGCGEASLEPIDQAQLAIAYGEASGPDDDGIVQVRSNAGSVIQNCTGTLVAENLLLTARHCVAQFVDDTFSCTADGELVEGSKGGRIGPPLTPSAISIRVGAVDTAPVAAVGKRVFTLQSPSICRNDIAMVVLDRAVTGVPIFAIRLNSGNERGDQIRVVGYGADEQNGFGTRVTRSGIKISKVGSSVFHPDADNIPARTFQVDGAVACHGDSGGPALSEKNAVVGVFSQVVGPCFATTAKDFYTQVGPYKDDFILPAFEAAGAEPMLEPSDPTGEAGASGEEPDAGSIAGGPSMIPSAGGAGVPEEDPTYSGPRQAGGCRCHMSSARAGLLEPEALLGLLMFGVAFGRRRQRASNQ